MSEQLFSKDLKGKVLTGRIVKATRNGYFVRTSDDLEVFIYKFKGGLKNWQEITNNLSENPNNMISVIKDKATPMKFELGWQLDSYEFYPVGKQPTWMTEKKKTGRKPGRPRKTEVEVKLSQELELKFDHAYMEAEEVFLKLFEEECKQKETGYVTTTGEKQEYPLTGRVNYYMPTGLFKKQLIEWGKKNKDKLKVASGYRHFGLSFKKNTECYSTQQEAGVQFFGSLILSGVDVPAINISYPGLVVDGRQQMFKLPLDKFLKK